MAIQFEQQDLMEVLSFLKHLFLASLSKIRWQYMCGFILIARSVILFHSPVWLYFFAYYLAVFVIALQYILKQGIVMPSAVLVLFRIVLAPLGFLSFYMEFNIFFFQFL